jgi:predicted O-methyltransferase YrrM
MRNVENVDAIQAIKERFAPDGGAEREHNAAETSLGFGAIHHALVRNLRPERVLVIGSRYGYVPAIIALALQANSKGVLDFVDANYSDAVHGPATAFGGVGNWEDPAGVFSDLEPEGIIQIYIMRSADFFEQHCDVRYDYVYIDGDHSYEGCCADFMHVLARLQEGAIIALHDVLVTAPGFGVGRGCSRSSKELAIASC